MTRNVLLHLGLLLALLVCSDAVIRLERMGIRKKDLHENENENELSAGAAPSPSSIGLAGVTGFFAAFDPVGLSSDYTVTGSPLLSSGSGFISSPAITNTLLFAASAPSCIFMQVAYQPTPTFNLAVPGTQWTATLAYYDVGFSFLAQSQAVYPLVSSIGISIIDVAVHRAINYEVLSDTVNRYIRNIGSDWNIGLSGCSGTISNTYSIIDSPQLSLGPTWVKVQSDGTTIKHSLSSNGVDWVQVGVQGINSGPNPVSATITSTSDSLVVGIGLQGWVPGSTPQYRILSWGVTTP